MEGACVGDGGWVSVVVMVVVRRRMLAGVVMEAGGWAVQAAQVGSGATLAEC